MPKKRLDVILFERGLVPSREKAQALIMAGLVLVDGRKIEKPGYRIKGNEKIEIIEGIKYVSRGGYKLEKALREFGINPEEKVCLDIGASTGGFTDCLLKHGAKRVYAVDVGRGQLDYKLRNDSRVIVYEDTDARELTEEHIKEKVDIITVDVSFISSTKVLPNVVKFLKEEGDLIVLVKPQFELCPKKVRKGIVRERGYRREAILKVIDFVSEELKMGVVNVIKSPIKGSKGNEEFFIHVRKDKKSPENINELVEKALDEKIELNI